MLPLSRRTRVLVHWVAITMEQSVYETKTQTENGNATHGQTKRLQVLTKATRWLVHQKKIPSRYFVSHVVSYYLEHAAPYFFIPPSTRTCTSRASSMAHCVALRHNLQVTETIFSLLARRPPTVCARICVGGGQRCCDWQRCS